MAGNATNLNNASVNAEGDEREKERDKIKGTPYRLRNLSYQQANLSQQSTVTSASEIDKIEEEEDEASVASEQDSVMGSMEDIAGEKRLLRREDWQGKNNAFKLDSVLEAVNKMYVMHQQCL